LSTLKNNRPLMISGDDHSETEIEERSAPNSALLADALGSQLRRAHRAAKRGRWA
jgi:hypothetical protein